MADQIKELIAKIQQEGVEAAQAKAKRIEEEANARAQGIIARAEKQAHQLLTQAKDEIPRMEQSSKITLEQAGRNLLLKLHEEIDALLKRIILLNLRQALKPQELTKIIVSLIENAETKDKADIIVTLNKKDLEKLEQDFLGNLKEEVKQGVTLKSSEDLQAGFIISYDQGKSHFDFSDESLAEYIAAHLKPALSEIFKQSAKKSQKR